MAQNDIYLVRESSDGTFEEIANSPLRYDAANATDAPDKANNTFHINTKLRVDELEVNGDTTVIHTDSNTTEQLSVTNDGTGPAAIINQIGAEPLIDIQDDGVSALYIEDGGNVGIGTTNPTAPLHVVGNSAFTDPGGIGSSLIIGHPSIGGGAQSAQIRMYDSNDVLNMNLIGGGEYVFYNGNVGIGPLGASSAAGDMLHISTAELNCGLTLHAETKQAKLIANNEGTLSLIAGNGGNSPAAKMVFELNGSEVMRIDPAGVLNIGDGSDSAWVKLTSTLGTFSLGSATYDMVDGVDTKKYFSIYDDDAAKHRVWINEIGDVGIGTTNPSAKLEINSSEGNQYALKATRANGTRLAAIFQDGNLNGTIGAYNSSDTPKVWLNTNGDSYFTGGNVGIGTMSPDSKLHLEGVATADARVTLEQTTANLKAEIQQGSEGFALSAIGNQSLLLQTNGSERLRIDQSGNVGIGTTNPNGTLELSSTSTDTNLYMGGTPAAGTREPWRVQAEGDYLSIGQVKSSFAKYMTFKGSNVGIGTSAPEVPLMIKGNSSADSMIKLLDEAAYVEGEARSAISFQGNDAGGVRTSFGGIEAYGASGQRGGLRFLSRPEASSTAVGMVLNEDNNVGIGTASPDMRLDVREDKDTTYGTVNHGPAWTAFLRNHEAEVADRFAGIGFQSASPAGGYATGWIGVVSKDKVGDMVFGIRDEDGSAKDYHEAMRITSGGNVGIGTNNPLDKLVVAGNIKAWSESGNAGFLGSIQTGQTTIKLMTDGDSYLTGGNVGIGTTSPSTTLDVDGDINFSGNIYQNGSLFSGSGAGGGGGSTQNPDGSWSGGTSFGGGTPSTNYPNPLDVSSDTSTGTSFTISSTYDDGTSQGTGNTYRFLSDTDGGLKIGPDGGDGTSFANNAMLLLLPEPMGGDVSGSQARSKLSVQNSYLEVLGHTDLTAGSGYNQDGTELKLLTHIGNKSTYHGYVPFDFQALNSDDTHPIYYFHLAFRNSSAGTMNGFKYKAEIGSSRLSTANNTTHWVNTGFVTDESFVYFEDDLDYHANNQHVGIVNSVGDIETVSREVYPTRDDSGDLWGMKALPGDSDLTLDQQTSYIVRYGMRFGKNFLYGTAPQGNAEKEARLYIQLEVMHAGGYGWGVLAPHFINVPLSTAAPNVTGLAYDPSPSTPNRMHFGWNDVPGAGRTYRIEVATDSGFTNLVHSVASYGAAQESVSGLTPNTLYYVRVKANPIAGEDVESLNWATMSATTKT